MKRTDITDIFPEATKEQIDRLMGLNGADVNAAKEELQGMKDQINALRKSAEETTASAAALQAANDEIIQLKNQLDGMKNAEMIRGIREKVSGEKKIPANLLTGETEEDCAKQADAILAYARTTGYPSVPDGGEFHHTPSTSTRDQFAKWAADNL